MLILPLMTMPDVGSGRPQPKKEIITKIKATTDKSSDIFFICLILRVYIFVGAKIGKKGEMGEWGTWGERGEVGAWGLN